MLNSEDSLGVGLKVIHNPIDSVGKSWLKWGLPDDCVIYNNDCNGLVRGIDKGFDITNNMSDITLEDNKTLKQHLSEYRNTEHGCDFESFKLF